MLLDCATSTHIALVNSGCFPPLGIAAGCSTSHTDFFLNAYSSSCPALPRRHSRPTVDGVHVTLLLGKAGRVIWLVSPPHKRQYGQVSHTVVSARPRRVSPVPHSGRLRDPVYKPREDLNPRLSYSHLEHSSRCSIRVHALSRYFTPQPLLLLCSPLSSFPSKNHVSGLCRSQ